MTISSFLAGRALSLTKGRLNNEAMRRARQMALGMRIRNNHEDIKEAMRQAGVDSFVAHIVVESDSVNGSVRITTEPVLDASVLMEDAGLLINLGFSLVKIEVTMEAIRFLALEYNPDRVKTYLEDNAGLSVALRLAQGVEKEIKKL